MHEELTYEQCDLSLLRCVLATFPSGSVLVINRDFHILFAQGGGLTNGLIHKRAVLDQKLAVIFPTDLIAAIAPDLRHVFSGEEANFDTRLNGRILEVRATPYQYENDEIATVVVVVNDATEERLRDTRLWLLDEASNVLAASLDINSTLTGLAHLLVPHLADWCAIHLLSNDGRVERIAVTHADPTKAELARELTDGYEFNWNAEYGPARVFRTGKSELHAETTDQMLQTTAVDERQLSLLRSVGIASSIVVPMKIRERVVGTISLTIVEPHLPFLEDTLGLVEDLAHRAALAVENARMYAVVRQELVRREEMAKGDRLRETALGRLLRSDVIGIATTERDWIVEANDVFLRMVGYERRDIDSGGLNWRAITPPEYLQLDDNAIAELLSTGSFTPFEKEYIRQDGTRVPVLIGAALIERSPVRWVCFVVDLSARRSFEDAHQAFMEDIGHDLRSPISITRWAAQLMRRQLRSGRIDADDLDRGLATIEQSTVRMASLVNGLMDAARMRMGQPVELDLELTNLVELVERCAEGFRRITNRHTVSIHKANDDELIGMWDRARLERILDNLISNAIKYSPEGGEVEVNLARERNPDGDWALLDVQDRGIGISEEELPTVFDRFRRGAEAAAQAPGSGIGLAGVKQFVEQQGGTIDVKSRPGEGTRFVVRLPMAQPCPPQIPASCL